MTAQGIVKSFNGAKGWGFVEYGGLDVFVHIKDCTGGQPALGDILTFDVEPSSHKPGQMQAKNVSGGTAPREMQTGGCGGGMMGGMMEGMMGGRMGGNMMGGGMMGGGMMGGGMMGGSMMGGMASQMAGMISGVVKSFNPSKGFGFIEVPGTPDVFLHLNNCVGSQPVVGDTVSFSVETSNSRPGQMIAKNVTGGSAPLGSSTGYGPATMGGMASMSGPYARMGGGGCGMGGMCGTGGLGGMCGGGMGGMCGGMGGGSFTGILKSFNAEKGFGFIEVAGSADVFLHVRDCIGTKPQVGDALQFNVQPSSKAGQMKAISVIGGTAGPLTG